MVGLLKVLQKKLVFSSSSFILGATAYLSVVLNVALWRFIFKTVEIDGFGSVLFGLSLPVIVFIELYFFFNLILIKYTIKPLLIFLLILSAIANYTMGVYGIFIDREMMRNVFETNTRETLELFTLSSVMWVCVTGVVPAVLVGMSVIHFKPFKQE